MPPRPRRTVPASRRREELYNPLDKRHLGESVAKALLDRPLEPLPPTETFRGAGVYAIYYVGARKLYGCLAPAGTRGKHQRPIYVGKAIPAGGRKGGVEATSPGPVLFNRLRKHADSIQQARNLTLADFRCRFLVVDDIWIPLGETLLIDMFSPVWNQVAEGFGNNDPGAGRHAGKRSPWDVLHPGRTWAKRCRPHPKSRDELVREVRAFLKTGGDGGQE